MAYGFARKRQPTWLPDVAQTKGIRGCAPFGEGKSRSQLSSVLLEAAQQGHARIAIQVIEAGAEVDFRYLRSYNGYGPLHLATKYGRLDAMDVLAQTGADLELRTLKSNATALHIAASQNQLGPLRKLIEWGVSLRAMNHRDETPLILAAHSGSLACLKHIISVSSIEDLDLMDQRGDSALHHACRNGHGQCAVELVMSGATVGLPNHQVNMPSAFCCLLSFSFNRLLLP